MDGRKFGLLGRKLGHSWSPQIHAMLAGYDYRLYPVEPEDLDRFLTETDLAGMNVTIPYKQDVMARCASVSAAARRIGSVNTLVRTAEGWHGDNTDYAGFCYITRAAGIDPAGKKALLFGTGGASLAVKAALEDMGVRETVSVSRTGKNNYDNLYLHRDAQLLVNATPLGMVPDAGSLPAHPGDFPQCEGVLDVVYNPQRTAFFMEAERLGIPCAGGLGMLVAQAKHSAEQFAGHSIPDQRVEEIMSTLSRQMSNIILIGMPGCGKSTVGRALARRMGRPFLDADAEIEAAAGQSIPDIFAREGEEGFRARETAVLARLGMGSGAVIATGGGCVTRAENYPLLHQNGFIVWLQRDLGSLAKKGRPLSLKHSPQVLFDQRRDKYAAFADLIVDNNGPRQAAVDAIWEAVQ